MNILIILVLPIAAIMLIAYGTDFIYLLHWAVQSGFERPFFTSSGQGKRVREIDRDRQTTDTVIDDGGQKNTRDDVLPSLSSSETIKKLQGEKLINHVHVDTMEQELLKLVMDENSDPETANSAAGILLERGGEEIIPLLAQFFSQKDKGIAGFLDDRDYNKVVNLFN